MFNQSVFQYLTLGRQVDSEEFFYPTASYSHGSGQGPISRNNRARIVAVRVRIRIRIRIQYDLYRAHPAHFPTATPIRCSSLGPIAPNRNTSPSSSITHGSANRWFPSPKNVRSHTTNGSPTFLS